MAPLPPPPPPIATVQITQGFKMKSDMSKAEALKILSSFLSQQYEPQLDPGIIEDHLNQYVFDSIDENGCAYHWLTYVKDAQNGYYGSKEYTGTNITSKHYGGLLHDTGVITGGYTIYHFTPFYFHYETGQPIHVNFADVTRIETRQAVLPQVGRIDNEIMVCLLSDTGSILDSSILLYPFGDPTGEYQAKIISALLALCPNVK